MLIRHKFRSTAWNGLTTATIAHRFTSPTRRAALNSTNGLKIAPSDAAAGMKFLVNLPLTIGLQGRSDSPTPSKFVPLQA